MAAASPLEPPEERGGGTDVTSINYYLSQMGILQTLPTRQDGGSLEQIGNLHSASLTERGELTKHSAGHSLQCSRLQNSGKAASLMKTDCIGGFREKKRSPDTARNRIKLLVRAQAESCAHQMFKFGPVQM